MSGKVRVNFFLQKDYYDMLTDISEKEDKAIASLLRDAVKEYIWSWKKKDINKFFKSVNKEDRDVREPSGTDQ